MLFKEILDKYKPEVEEAVNELFEEVKKNQTHEQDLLLVEINGFYMEPPNNPKLEKISPFVFGPGGWDYHANYTQYRFFNGYRRMIISDNPDTLLKESKTDENKKDAYELSIQMELMVYLKFWESTHTLKQLYHLSNLALGKSYDWFFKISKDDSRHTIIRENIRDSIKTTCPKYHKLLKDIYLSQIRNAAAHSSFYVIDGKLGFTNFNKNNHAPLTQIEFKDWEERFHKLILMYNELIYNFNLLKQDYIKKQEGKEFGLPIRLTEKNGKESIQWIKYADAGREDWIWYETWKEHYKGK